MKKTINKLKDRFDYLWVGDRDTLISMWLTILLATVLVVEAVIMGYLTFFN